MTESDNDHDHNYEDKTNPEIEANESVASDIDNYDFERANMLMGVMEKVANVAPKATSISGLASQALNEMNEEAKDIARRRAEAYAAAEAKRLEMEQRRQKDELEAAEHEANETREKDERARTIPAAQFEKPDPTPGQPQQNVNPNGVAARRNPPSGDARRV